MAKKGKIKESQLQSVLAAAADCKVPTLRNIAAKAGVSEGLCLRILLEAERRGLVKERASAHTDVKTARSVLIAGPGGYATLDEAPRKHPHNYLLKLQWLANSGKYNMTVGSVNNVEIKHDDYCEILSGDGYCNCDPDILLNGSILETPPIRKLLQAERARMEES